MRDAPYRYSAKRLSADKPRETSRSAKALKGVTDNRKGGKPDVEAELSAEGGARSER